MLSSAPMGHERPLQVAVLCFQWSVGLSWLHPFCCGPISVTTWPGRRRWDTKDGEKVKIQGSHLALSAWDLSRKNQLCGWSWGSAWGIVPETDVRLPGRAILWGRKGKLCIVSSLAGNRSCTCAHPGPTGLRKQPQPWWKLMAWLSIFSFPLPLRTATHRAGRLGHSAGS